MILMTRRSMMTGLLGVTVLPGCAALSAFGEATAVLDAYDLRAPDLPQAGRTLGRALSIEPPTTSGALDTDRIMIRPSPVQALYLPGARWSEDTPALLQTLMLRGFDDTGALTYVGRRPIGATGDVALLTEITDFQAELDADGSSALIRLRVVARMIRESDAQVLARRTFTALAPSASTDTLEIVQAFNMASDQLLTDLVRWGLGVIGVQLPAV